MEPEVPQDAAENKQELLTAISRLQNDARLVGVHEFMMLMEAAPAPALAPGARADPSRAIRRDVRFAVW